MCAVNPWETVNNESMAQQRISISKTFKAQVIGETWGLSPASQWRKINGVWDLVSIVISKLYLDTTSHCGSSNSQNWAVPLECIQHVATTQRLLDTLKRYHWSTQHQIHTCQYPLAVWLDRVCMITCLSRLLLTPQSSAVWLRARLPPHFLWKRLPSQVIKFSVNVLARIWEYKWFQWSVDWNLIDQNAPFSVIQVDLCAMNAEERSWWCLACQMKRQSQAEPNRTINIVSDTASPTRLSEETCHL